MLNISLDPSPCSRLNLAMHLCSNKTVTGFNRNKILHTPKKKCHFQWSRIFPVLESHENKVLFKNQFWNRPPAAFISHWKKKVFLRSVKPGNGWVLVICTSDRKSSFIFQLQTCLHFKSWNKTRHFSCYAKRESTSRLCMYTPPTAFLKYRKLP